MNGLNAICSGTVSYTHLDVYKRQKYGTAICALAVMVAPVAARSCKLLWYESEQPDGLDKFVAEHTEKY